MRNINGISFRDPGFFGNSREMEKGTPKVEIENQIVADVTLQGTGSTPIPLTFRFDDLGHSIMIPWVNAA